MFTITVDPERGFFEVATSGFWTLDTVAEFGAALQQTIQRIRATGRTPLSLADNSGLMVQSQEVVAAFMKMMENPAVRSARVAVYTTGALAKTQAIRANQKHEEFGFFDSREEALAWLFASEGPMRAAG